MGGGRARVREEEENERGAPAIEEFLVLWIGLLIIVILGMVTALRHEQRRVQQAGSLTEITFVPALRAEIKRLREDTRRLRAERDELLGVLAQLARLLDAHEGPSQRSS